MAGVRVSSWVLVWAGLLAAGCGHEPAPAPQGPSAPVSLELESYPVDGVAGCRVVSPHYLIYSTVPDRQLLVRVGELMEGALSVYHAVAPEVPQSPRPMECYLFATRPQWAEFTRTHTGDDAAIYLRVNRGGYTVGDWFVAYWIGETGTYSVAAHEGWHQYVARHLRGRLPPFLEEGLACMFEEVHWDGDKPRWDLSRNTARLSSLRIAIDHGQTIPLSQLVRMHAGQVVGKPSSQIEAFYAQGWAFARFLYDAEGARYRPALRKMLADAARGSLFHDSSRQFPRGPLWDPATAQPMIEHYLRMDMSQVEAAYDRYVRLIVSHSATGGSES